MAVTLPLIVALAFLWFGSPIVRINPREVHISDPDFYDEIYAPAARVRWKDPKQVPMIGAPFSMGATWHHGHHRFRRSLIKNHFSRQSIEKITTTIRKKAEILCGRLEEASATGCPLNVSDAFAALTSDIIAGYAFDIDLGFLEDPLFRNDVYRSALELDMLCHVLKFFPFLLKPVRWLPSSVTEVLGLQNKSLGSLQEVIDQRIISSLRTTNQSGHVQEKERDSIFTSLCHQDVPPEERTLERLRDESLVLLIAGAEATARALAVFAYYMATGSINLQKLRHELRQVMPTCTSQASWAELEHLPYLSGVVNESLRLSLAQCQLHFTIAAVARRFDFELFETTEEDIRVARDYITAFPKDGLFDVKVTIRSSPGE
ncbi:benzoate 4-monooxygenase cytochrome P450 [Aspergillus terreus]|uniref:Benzoate 4-monooxygenase cytochrome P450 n=1 Tax=Aspergillus terreus TaxID=33178 RepID=A0A5M3Z0E3_ASPTE|nr:hypothetical protein ATETN484_0005004000 [Aspergillus terreus]GFF16707.1 benzoate 4-monooxygenase cytochrome P450 [Aspergillus terreus]